MSFHAPSSFLIPHPTYVHFGIEFGKGIIGPDGQINRAVLGSLVFGNAAAVNRLSSIVWPAVKDLALKGALPCKWYSLLRKNKETIKMETAIQNNASLPPVIVLEAALLVEAGWKNDFDKLWVFKVPPAVAQQRIMARNNLSWEEAGKRLSSQLSNEEREKHADVVFDTDRDPDQVKRDVVAEWNKLLAQARL
jgi:phosphopantetheine adenylyltransferase/dephospho-CoA kinase